jgi:SAM-dependent methyltransferase
MTMWHERWAEEKTGWDLNGPHPLTRYLYETAKGFDPKHVAGRWLMPGCGRGHDGTLLLAMGAASVEGRDLVPRAIDEAKRLYASVDRLSFRCCDINDLGLADLSGFDCIFDRAMLCALQGADRHQYVRSCASCLRPGGLFASLAFASTTDPEQGPPFQILQSEIYDFFDKSWKVEFLEERRDGACGQKILSEWVLIARRL